jgi:tRNA pseudouridine55 synthase
VIATVSGRIPTRRVDGLLLVDKPVGPSSNAVLQRVKRLFRAAKAGHTGTLDPMASGLLVVCFGEATKFSSALLEGDKCYSGVIELGVTTTTGDAEGEVVERNPVPAGNIDSVALASRFSGEITQVPPSYSAIKVNGRPLYAYAREGTVVAAKPRQVRIHALELERDGIDRLRFSVRCGGGTYVRSLAEDIGRAIGCGAHLASLRREGAGCFEATSAVGLEALEGMPDDERLARLLSPDAALYKLPSLTLDEAAVVALLQGRHPDVPAGAAVGKSRIYDQSGRFLGVAEALAGERLVPVRLMSTGAPAKEPADPC